MWRLKLTCAGKSDHARVRVTGALGTRAARLFARNTLKARAVDHERLDDAYIPSSYQAKADKESGGPDPDFRIPFRCKAKWTASTYPGHGLAIDWNAPRDRGRRVLSSADGTAHLRPFGRRNGGYGNTVEIDHGGKWTTVYAHLGSYAVREGQIVRRGQTIGRVGNSGNSSGAELHYEQRFEGILKPVRFSNRPVRLGLRSSDNCFDPPPPPPLEQGPRVVLRVDNRVTNGNSMREDETPTRLTTQPFAFCGARACNIYGTERRSGGTYDAAICQTLGEPTHNGSDSDPDDDANPERYESTLYYGVRLRAGTFGYVSEVWIQRNFRGGMGLPEC